MNGNANFIMHIIKNVVMSSQYWSNKNLVYCQQLSKHAKFIIIIKLITARSKSPMLADSHWNILNLKFTATGRKVEVLASHPTCAQLAK